jgi:hypothetical protein
MPRYAYKISKEDLYTKFVEKFGEYGCDILEEPKAYSDVAKIEFDTENFQAKPYTGLAYNDLLGPQQIGDLAFVGCSAGGDWEFPVFMIFYLDQNGKTWRGYIPTDGNVYNTKTKRAIGNSDEDDTPSEPDMGNSHSPKSDEAVLQAYARKHRDRLKFDEEDIAVLSSEDADIMVDIEALKADITNRIAVK